MLSTVHGTLAALADETRQSVVDFLSNEPRRASDIAAALGLTPQAMSRHLRVLRRGGLIREEGIEDDARVRVYHTISAGCARNRISKTLPATRLPAAWV